MATRWSPDTCDCVIEYTDDFIKPVYIQQCTKHAKSSDPNDVLAHNRKRNAVAAFVSAQGTIVDGLSGAVDAAVVSYDRSAPVGADPVLVTAPKVSGATKGVLQTALDVAFGVNGVAVK